MGVTTRTTRPAADLYLREDARSKRILERAAAVSVDKATRGAAAQLKTTIRARGLGNLANALGNTSSLRKGKTTGSNAYGAIFAKGGDDSLAGGALEAYGRGRTINPKQGKYLWFQTKALKRRVGRLRMTPERYVASGEPLGKLLFRQKANGIGELFVKGVVVSAKNGRARVPGARSKAKTTIVVLFIGIRNTTRLKRFDKDEIVSLYAGLVPAYMIDEIAVALRAG